MNTEEEKIEIIKLNTSNQTANCDNLLTTGINISKIKNVVTNTNTDINTNTNTNASKLMTDVTHSMENMMHTIENVAIEAQMIASELKHMATEIATDIGNSTRDITLDFSIGDLFRL